MSDFDYEDQGSEDGAKQLAALQTKIDELEKDNAKYREERRATAEAAFLDKYGPEIVDDVKDLPDEHRATMAEKLLKLRADNQPKQNEQAAEPVSQGDEAGSGLAAVMNASAPGGTLPEDLKTVAEIKELMKTDPVKANELVTAGKFVKQSEW